MTLLHDPERVGFLRRFRRIYREKRRSRLVVEQYPAGRILRDQPPNTRLVCAQIAWTQTRNAQSLRK